MAHAGITHFMIGIAGKDILLLTSIFLNPAASIISRQ
jgi:hypothetical protein